MPAVKTFGKILLPLAAASLMSGCAAMPADRGFGDVRGLIGARGGPELSPPGGETGPRLAELLAEPLTADRAVAIGLLRSPELRAMYARLGLAQAEVLEASRSSNPRLSYGRLEAHGVEAATLHSYGIAQNFTDALFLQARTRIARDGVERAKQLAAARVQGLAAEIGAAHYCLVGAVQVARMRDAVARAADASAEFAKRLYDAGNINEFEWRTAQAAGTQARLDGETAAAEATAARAELNRLMGLRSGEADWTIAEILPLPATDEDPLDSLRALAYEQRLDLAAKRREIAQLEKVRDLARKLRWVPFVDVGYVREPDPDGTRLVGPTLDLELPLFNQGQGSVARAEMELEQARAELAALEIDAGNAVAAAYGRMAAAARRVARYRHELLPQREAAVRRAQELQNYMIVGQFELLLTKQQEYDAFQGYLEALRDYWLARTDLAREVGAKLPSDARIGETEVSALPLPDEPPAGDHGAHLLKQDSTGGHEGHP